jgi:hypothetical protein
MPHTSKSRTRRTLTGNGILLFVLCSLLVSQFAATSHELAVRHATCLQHGELVEVDASSGVVDSPAAQTQLSATIVGGTQTQHQHCAFVFSRVGHKIFRLQPAHSVELPMQGEQACCSLTEHRQLSRALYLTAPKHSPPSA